MSALSGGNLQRLLLGRELTGEPKVLVAAQPTRGLDVAGIAAIQSQIVSQRAAGVAVLLISEDLDELLALSDRLIVMYEGQIAARAWTPRKSPGPTSAPPWPERHRRDRTDTRPAAHRRPGAGALASRHRSAGAPAARPGGAGGAGHRVRDRHRAGANRRGAPAVGLRQRPGRGVPANGRIIARRVRCLLADAAARDAASNRGPGGGGGRLDGPVEHRCRGSDDGRRHGRGRLCHGGRRSAGTRADRADAGGRCGGGRPARRGTRTGARLSRRQRDHHDADAGRSGDTHRGMAQGGSMERS